MKIRELIVSGKKRLVAGFSMVEATVGLAILATVGGALMTGIGNGFFTMQMARENLRATQIMLEKVETIRLYDWDQITNSGPALGTNSFIPITFTNYYDPNGRSLGAQYRGQLRILPATMIDSSYSNDMRMVSVTLNWQTASHPRTRTFTTFISRDGLQNYVY
jgi:hypothetical protein